jgi:hypothetical protein
VNTRLFGDDLPPDQAGDPGPATGAGDGTGGQQVRRPVTIMV